MSKETTKTNLIVEAKKALAGNHSMFFHTSLADVKFEDGTKAKIDLTANNTAIVVTVGEWNNGTQYVVTLESIVDAIVLDLKADETNQP